MDSCKAKKTYKTYKTWFICEIYERSTPFSLPFFFPNQVPRKNIHVKGDCKINNG